MAVPKIMDLGMTVCRQDKTGYIKNTQVTPSLKFKEHMTLFVGYAMRLWEQCCEEKRCRDGVTCSLGIISLACTLPSVHVHVVFCFFLHCHPLHFCFLYLFVD